MSEHLDQAFRSSPAGRQAVLTPVPPGFWLVIGGSAVTALGPMFGFLLGSMAGSNTGSTMGTGDLGPIYLFLFIGLAVGGLGVAAALLGARKVIGARRTAAG